MDTITYQKLLQRGLRKTFLALLIASVMFASFPVQLAQASTNYIDEFSVYSYDDFDTSFETGTFSTGLSYNCTECYFLSPSSGRIPAKQSHHTANRSITITARDGDTFDFNSLSVSSFNPFLITGYGPEPFSIYTPFSVGQMTVGPSSPSRVTRVVITPGTIGADFDILFDNVDVVLFDPEVDLQRPAGASIPDGSWDDLGTLPLDFVSLTYTLANTGDSDLTIGSVTADYLNNVSNFNVAIAPSSPVAPSNSVEFTIEFEIDAPGPFFFNLDIPSNDANENIYDLRILGIRDTAPPGLTSFTRQTLTSSPTDMDSLVFRAAFDEAVQNVSAADFSVTGTTASATGIEPVSAASMMGAYPVATGNYHTCVVESDQSLTCWGLDNLSQSSPPGGTDFAMVGAGAFHNCALRIGGSLSCWGDDSYGQASPPAGTDFALVSVGDGYTCALKNDGSLTCWGRNDDGEASPPTGTDYALVSAGYRDTCALKEDGSLTCWGLNHVGQGNPPSGTDYTMVSSGEYYSCALKDDGSLACWGFDGDGRSSPPAGTDYDMVSAGEEHACALRNNGSVACWGNNDYGQSSPPAGTDFALVSAGRKHTCALKNDRSLVCWGDDEYNQSSPPAGLLVEPISTRVFDVTVSGGDLAGLNGEVGLDLAAGQNIIDLVGNALSAGEPATDETYMVNNAPNLISFTRQTPASSPTNADTLVFRATFDEAVQNVDASDFAVTGASASVTGVNPISAAVYDLTVSGGDLAGLNGTVGLDLAVGLNITDLLGSALPADEPSTDETYLLDNTGPVPMISQALGQSDPTSNQPINFKVDFGEAVTGFDAADLTFGGTAPGTPAASVTGGPQTYNAAISGLTGDGTLTIDFNVGAAQDAVGNPSAAPILTDNQVTFDGDPEIDLQRPAGTSILDGGEDALGSRVLGRVSLTYTIDNTAGTDVLTVSSVTGSNLINVSGFSLDTSTPINVAGGEAATFDLSFDLEVNGPFSLDLTLGNNDGDEDPYNLTLTGTGTGGEPEIDLQRPSGTSIINGSTDAIGGPGVGTVHLTYRLDNTAGTSELGVTAINPSNLTNVSNFVFSPGTPIRVPALSTGTFDVSFDVLAEGAFSFDVAISNNDSDEGSYTFQGFGTALDLQVLMSGGTSPLDGAVLYEGPSALTVQFNKDVQSGGGSGAADNPANYLLVEAGLDGEHDTTSCALSAADDDQTIAIIGASYDPVLRTATLDIDAAPLLNGSYRLLICGTTSVRDLFNIELNRGLTDALISFLVTDRPSLPDTGFTPNQFTSLPTQPLEKQYHSLGNLWLEIPSLGLQQTIIGVPQTADGWDVTWLGNRIGYLSGTAFPTWSGNTGLTGHVYNADGQPGPFEELGQLAWGEGVRVHAFGQVYTYEVRSVQNWVRPADSRVLTRHEDYDWITLITCRGYEESSGGYAYRSVVRAVLVKVEAE